MKISFDTRGNVKQLSACQAWHDKETELIMFGGAKYGGKSYLGAALIFIDALMYPGTHYFIARATLNDLRKYTMPTIFEVMKHLSLEPNQYMRYNGQDNFFQLYNGSKVFLIDAAYKPSDRDFHRFGSIQMTRGWLEEIGEMHHKAIEALLLTIGRWKNEEYGIKKKALLTCNPHKGYGYTEFYIPAKKGELPKEKKFIQALPQDNLAGDKDYIHGILNHKSKAIRKRLGEGSWEYDDNPDVLVDIDRIMDAFSNFHVPEGQKAMTADIAFMGSDRFVIGIWSGWILKKMYIIDKSTAKDVESTIKSLAEKEEIPRSKIVYDSDGIGSFLDSYMKNARPFHNGAKAIGKDKYASLKDQCGFGLARKFNEGGIRLEIPEEEQEVIIREMEMLKSYNTDKDGKLQILPKIKIKEEIGRSPDVLDMLIMRYYLEVNKMEITSSVPM